MNDIYVLLGDDANKEQIDVIYKMYSDRILERIKKYDSDINEIPNELNFILTEVTIERYNRIGSEGMKKESHDGYTADYRDDTDLLIKYESYIEHYLNSLHDDKDSNIGIKFL